MLQRPAIQASTWLSFRFQKILNREPNYLNPQIIRKRKDEDPDDDVYVLLAMNENSQLIVLQVLVFDCFK